jgi:predicted ArsR family transcriptional regulator
VILQRVLELLAANAVASPATIATAVGSTPDAVRNMLATLERRGLVQRYAPPSACAGGCQQCGQGTAEFYRLAPVSRDDAGDEGGGCPVRR